MSAAKQYKTSKHTTKNMQYVHKTQSSSITGKWLGVLIAKASTPNTLKRNATSTNQTTISAKAACRLKRGVPGGEEHGVVGDVRVCQRQGLHGRNIHPFSKGPLYECTAALRTS